MWSNWAENAKSSMTQALEKTGDAISKAATNIPKNARQQQQHHQNQSSTAAAADTTEEEGSTTSTDAASKKGPPELLTNISQGWNTVLQNTRNMTKQAEAHMKEQQLKLTDQLSKVRTAYYKRDPKLPLDVEALKDAEVVYVTDRLITMGHPAIYSQTNGDISGERKLAAVGHLLHRRHEGRFMVWNLSEVDYEISALEEQVMTYSFPGSPSPPLGLLLKLLVSMESWLKADERNVAVLHCLTGKGRTSLVLAAFLCWMGEAQFHDIYDALNYIATCKQLTVEELTIPSQRRYASYFKNMLDGVRPSQPPILLKRIIMSEAPRFAKGPPRKKTDDETKKEDPDSLMGCVPYLQIFKAGKLLHTAPASLHFQQDENELPFCQVADGNISFHVNLVIQGDILVRARHLTAQKKRVSMFRAAFHTGYVPPNVMRLTKAQLDGACSDDRFVGDFFLDFIFESVDAEEASKLLKEEDDGETKVDAKGQSKKVNAVTASADDTMLHRDSRFWDVIAERMKANAASSGSTSEDPLFGPTVGRRRDFSAPDDGTEKTDAKSAATQPSQHSIETFSIGGEFDFLPETVEPEASHPVDDVKRAAAPKKDSLMEALMGALDDDPPDRGDEVIVFDSDDSQADSKAKASDVPPPGETSDTATATPSDTMEKESETASKASSGADMDALLAAANLNLDDDVDALLADTTGADVLSDDDLLNLDIDDSDLDDLESFLTPTSK